MTGLRWRCCSWCAATSAPTRMTICTRRCPSCCAKPHWQACVRVFLHRAPCTQARVVLALHATMIVALGVTFFVKASAISCVWFGNSPYSVNCAVRGACPTMKPRSAFYWSARGRRIIAHLEWAVGFAHTRYQMPARSVVVNDVAVLTLSSPLTDITRSQSSRTVGKSSSRRRPDIAEPYTLFFRLGEAALDQIRPTLT